jgi:integrase
MTDEIKAMFNRRKRGRPNEIVFKDRNGKQIKEASNSFGRAVDGLHLNREVIDRRQKVTFHSLRHTFASWLVQQGEPLYTVQKLMGHASLSMTERYSHLSPDNMKRAVKNFEKNLKDKRTETKKVIDLKKKEED